MCFLALNFTNIHFSYECCSLSSCMANSIGNCGQRALCYSYATAHFASFSPLENLCFCDAVACFIKQLFWYFHAIFGCKLKWELSKINLLHGAIFWMIEHAVLYFNRRKMSWDLMMLNFQKNIFLLWSLSNYWHFRLVSGILCRKSRLV